MRLIALILFAAASCGAASAQTQDCRAIADPSAQVACYNNVSPAAPAAKRSRPAASQAPQRSKVESEKSIESLDAEETVMRARINGICRGC